MHIAVSESHTTRSQHSHGIKLSIAMSGGRVPKLQHLHETIPLELNVKWKLKLHLLLEHLRLYSYKPYLCVWAYVERVIVSVVTVKIHKGTYVLI